MFTLSLYCREDEKDALIGELWERATAGVVEHPQPDGRWRLEAFFDERPSIDAFGAWLPVVGNAEDRDYVADFEASWPAVEIGARFFLVAPWSGAPTPEGRVRIEYMPGMACGTGAHPATQLCLAAFDRYVRAGDVVVDVGAGSGILSRGALLAGARRVIACDIDAAAAAIAHANVPEALCFAGSTRSLRSKCADVAVANLNATTLTMLAAELRRLAPVLIVSGFERNDADAVARVLAPIETLSDGAWRCFVTGG